MPLSNDRESRRSDGTRMDNLKKAATVIYGGSLVNRLSSDGKVQPGGDTASTTFGGVAVRRALAADTHVDTYTEGEFLFTFGAGSLTAASIGVEVYITDESTVDVAATTTNDIKCGIIRTVPSATTCRISINGYVK